MPSDNVYGVLRNADSVALTRGMVVRVSATDSIVRAQADSTPHLQGLVGIINSGNVGVGGVANVVSEAVQQLVLFETGLTLAPGETFYVSDTVAGRATNVAPAIPVALGTIVDTNLYTQSALVYASVSVPAEAVGGGGAFPGYGVADLPVGPATGGTSLGVARADHQHPPLTAASTAAMSALVVTAMPDGAACYLTPRASSFLLLTTALAADNVDIIASATAGRKWMRVVMKSVRWSNQIDWNVDTGAGDDDNTGLTGSPLKTVKECARRLWQAEFPLNGNACVMQLTGDMAAGDSGPFRIRCNGDFPISTPVSPAGYDTAFTIVGVPTDLGFAGVMSSVQNGALGSLLDIHFTDSGIPASFTASGFLARNVIFKRTTAPVCWFWPALDLGSKTLRASQPNGVVGVYPALANTNTYRVMQLPRIHDITFDQSIAEQADFMISLCSIPSTSNLLPTDMPITWDNVSFEATGQRVTGTLGNCQFAAGNDSGTSVGTLGGGGDAFIVSGLVRPGAGVTTGRLTIGASCTAQLSEEDAGFITFQGSNLVCDIDSRTTRAQLQFFDATNNLIALQQAAAVDLMTIGGAGNTAKILNTGSAGTKIVYDTLPNSGMTSDANPYKALGFSGTVPQSIPGANIYQTQNTAVGNAFQAVANGAVAISVTNVAPAGTAATIQRWIDIPDGAGGAFRVPSFL